MNASLLAKIAGWGQLAMQVLVQVATVGIPQGLGGWAAVGISLLTAVATHAASNTAGPAK
jgi:hypothetical protein